ncbi:hypothetical protein ACFPM3_20125 [Streptomyces coeruleoprunus]|uniref:Uncharacterized protein n=1 Tax=Streptomyces coeruleoprunus TaxID=285563 RepID=A0ABV9XG98_9ACTN
MDATYHLPGYSGLRIEIESARGAIDAAREGGWTALHYETLDRQGRALTVVAMVDKGRMHSVFEFAAGE